MIPPPFLYLNNMVECEKMMYPYTLYNNFDLPLQVFLRIFDLHPDHVSHPPTTFSKPTCNIFFSPRALSCHVAQYTDNLMSYIMY